jgi:uncharacterized membrane protein YukC
MEALTPKKKIVDMTYRELVFERERLKQAITNTKSRYLKKDYSKAIKRIDKILAKVI